MKPIRVGIIGMQIGRSWGAIAHLPALRAVPGYEVTAVCTTKQKTAEEAAAHYGIPQAFVGHEALVNSPEVDLVAVTVKVPAHLELVTAALQAGKHVYCEWPLGNGLAEAQQMAELAQARGVKTVIGLQARVSPVLAYLRDLIKDGYLGDVFSSSLIGSGVSWGADVDETHRYLVERRNGATMLSIPVGHTLDGVCSVLGEIEQVASVLANGRSEATLLETGELIPMTAPDQIGLIGRLANGAMFSAHYRGGAGPGTGLLWEIYGSKGTLRISGPSGHAQLVDLTVEGSEHPEGPLAKFKVPESYYHTELRGGVALNVAEMYHRFAQDLREGSASCPDFDHAVRAHERLELIENGALTAL